MVFSVPSYASVAITAMGHFQQEGMICKPMRVSGDLVYKFVLRKEVPKDGHELEFVVAGKTTKIPLYVFDRETRCTTSRPRIGGKKYFAIDVHTRFSSLKPPHLVCMDAS